VRGGHRERRAQARAPWLAVIRRGRGYCCCTAESRRALALRTDFAYQDAREFRHHHEDCRVLKEVLVQFGQGCIRGLNVFPHLPLAQTPEQQREL
jgi:hypothetical protein